MTLKSGYTTGTHATACLMGAVTGFLSKETLLWVSVILPGGDSVEIGVETLITDKTVTCRSFKSHNDDPDVTRGCEMICTVVEEAGLLRLNPEPHHPHEIRVNDAILYLYAGEGVGIVTKSGLKINPGFPAINPIPIQMMEHNLNRSGLSLKQNLHVAIGVREGETLAPQTANPKLGIIGGISILGNTGIVKPISHESFLESIRTEISVAAEQGCQELVFTLGNTAFAQAKHHYPEIQIIEVGNAIRESVALLTDAPVESLIFMAGPGKMVKIAQGFENTHQRYGEIDFKRVKQWLETLGIPNETIEWNTIRELFTVLDSDAKKKLEHLICDKAVQRLKGYAEKALSINPRIIGIT